MGWLAGRRTNQRYTGAEERTEHRAVCPTRSSRIYRVSGLETHRFLAI